jgi:hypothetical protein
VNTVKDLHHHAMQEADLGHAFRREGKDGPARQHFEEAFRLERTAAEQLLDRPEAEPSRSILFRSAATLAIEARAFTEAERMVCIGLTGAPPNNIAEELRDLFEQINFRRHLALRGVNLADREVQMSVAGRGVGFGIAPTDAVVERIGHTQSLIYRFTERILKKPYRDKGAPTREIRDAVSLFMSVPRAASFAVSLVVGGKQEALPGMSVAESVVEEVVECLDLFAREEEAALHQMIPDPAYMTNFNALAKAIAPDGEEVDLVGFTTLRGGVERTVALRPPRQKETLPPQFGTVPESPKPQAAVTVTGTLRFADALEPTHQVIKLLDDAGLRHSILVPAGMMDDIVRPLWSSRVRVSGLSSRGHIILTEIAKARD